MKMTDRRRERAHIVPPFTMIEPTAQFVAFITQPPTLDEAIRFIQARYGNRTSEDEIREWYDYMNCIAWANSKGEVARNWPYWFYVWRKNKARFDRLRAVPEGEGVGRTAYTAVSRVRRADNWLGASAESVANLEQMMAHDPRVFGKEG